MNILIACEESQEVCKAFREKGHNAYSCDVIDCSGGRPEWHIKCDVLEILEPKEHVGCHYEKAIHFTTVTGKKECVPKWDMIIAHPPCTYLSCAGNGYFNIEKYGDSAIERIKKRQEAYEFFIRIFNTDCDKICIENPAGYMNHHFRKPNQTIHPYYFAESVNDEKNFHMKRTCLWLKGLPNLVYRKPTEKPDPIYVDRISGKKRYYVDAITGNSKNGQKNRSKTFPGIALAMAEQWGGVSHETY